MHGPKMQCYRSSLFLPEASKRRNRSGVKHEFSQKIFDMALQVNGEPKQINEVVPTKRL
jgi:hypothetical protein